MQDRELYRKILGIERPWCVERVELKLSEGEVHVYLEHESGFIWPCAECGRATRLYDHQTERQWRHLDTCQYRTILHARPPRAECSEHGVRVVKLPWAEPSSRFTALFETLAISWLQQASQQAVAGQLGLSWDEIHGIMARAVARGLARRKAEPIDVLGVDEKAFRKGHRYFTLVNDVGRGRVLYVAEDRKKESLDGFWATLTPGQVQGVRAITMDMWDPFVNSTREHLPGADEKIVFDLFHIAKHLGEAVDTVRRQEQKALKAAGDSRLNRTKYLWLGNPANLKLEQRQQLSVLRQSNLKTARAWALKETFMAMFTYRDQDRVCALFRATCAWASRSRLKPMIEAARMLKRRFANIITFIRHRVTNATSESINAKVQWVKYTARGFRNKQNFVSAIYFHCGGLDLSPTQ